jgi:2-formylbenzoate dehydrogenase
MIVPFNHPTVFALQSLAPIALGNTVVLKPSEQSPLSALRIAEILGEVLPAGVFNVVTGRGQPTGNALVSHPLVELVVFTGSSAVGQIITEQAARSGIKRTILELGGKNPLIICADADLAKAAEAAVTGMNIERSQGQSCGSSSRLLVERTVYDEVVAAVKERMAAIQLGDPLNESTRMGPLVSLNHQRRVLDFIDQAVREGAIVATGGKAPDDPAFAGGAYVEPTLLTGVSPDMTIANEEVFGPVLSALSWETDEEALEIANAVRYGLTASIWTSDLGRAQRFVAEIEAARVFVNSPQRSVQGMSADAWKHSGLGLTGDWGVGLTNFLQLKAVHMAGT